MVITISVLPFFSTYCQVYVTGQVSWAWLALINTSLGYLLYNHALRELTALEMNMVMNLTPVFTAFISWILLRERLGLLQGLGLIVMIVGVILVQRGRKKINSDE